MARDPLRGPRRRQEGDRRGDQAGLPQARARLPPRPQPRRPAGRGAVQGGRRRLRHAQGPREAQAVRRRRDVRRLRAGPARAAPGPAASRVGDVGDIFSTIFGRGRGGPEPARGRDLETEIRLTFEQAMEGTQIPVTDPEAGALRHLRRQRRGARHAPGHLPALRGQRDRRAEPGLLLDLPALPAVRRPRRDRRAAVPRLPRQRAHLPAQALPGQRPGRGQGRDQDPARRQGRGRPARRPRRATSS